MTASHGASPMKVVVVSNQRHILAVSAYAGRPELVSGLSLLTSPAAAGYMGPRILKALTDQAAPVPAIIDCGDDPGLVMRALACGWRHFVYTGPAESKIQSLLSQSKALLHDPKIFERRLVLARNRSPEPILGDFLRSC